MPVNTLKRQKLIRNLETSSTLKEAGDKAGYRTSFGSRTIYRPSTRKHIAEALKCNPQSIIDHYEALYASCLQSEDKATAKAILDSLCRINAMFKDKTDITLNRGLNPELIDPNMIERARKGLLETKQNDVTPTIPIT